MKLNGNLVLNSAGQSEIQNMVVERVSGSLPAYSSAEKGRIVFFNGDSKFYINDGTQWVSLATGGNAAALQSEVDGIESALGGFVNTDGTFNAAALNALSSVDGATSLMNALTQIDAAITGKDQLSELLDVALSSPSDTEALMFNNTSGKWENRNVILTDVVDVTATSAEVNELHTSGAVLADFVKLHAVTSSAAELNILDGATLTTTELNYLVGVTSAVQTQLNNKQPLDAQLTSIAGQTPTLNQVLFGDNLGGYTLDSGAGARSKLGLTIGTDVQAWDADLDQIAGFVPASGSETGPFVGSRTVYDIIVGNGSTEGARYALQRGATARTSLGLGDIAVYDAASFIKVDGSSTVTANIKLDGWKLTNVGDPSAATDAANKGYVDAVAAGLSWKQAVDAATTANITLSGTQTVDGVVLVAGDRVLVKNQTTAADNGIYVVAAGAWTRAVDANSAAEVTDGTAVFVRGGTINADGGYVQTSAVVTLGTDAQTWTSFSGATSFVDGIGLKRTGNTVDVNLGAGIKELPSDEVGIDIYNIATAALILTTDGSSSSTATGAQLHLKTNQAQLEQDGTQGLYIVASGVTEAELAASVAGNGLTGGAGTPIAVASAAGTGATGGDTPANWGGVGLVTVTANAVGVTLGSTSTTAAPGNHTHKADTITYSNATSGLLASDTQAAIDEVEGRVDTLETNGSNLQTEVNNIETAVGLNANGTYAVPAGTNYLGSATTTIGAVVALDGKLKAAETALAARVANGYHLYSGAAATSHTVTHGIGSQYCNVTVIDTATDEQIIPNSVTFDSTTQLTVTLNTSLAIKVVVMGLAAYTPV